MKNISEDTDQNTSDNNSIVIDTNNTQTRNKHNIFSRLNNQICNYVISKVYSTPPTPLQQTAYNDHQEQKFQYKV